MCKIFILPSRVALPEKGTSDNKGDSLRIELQLQNTRQYRPTEV